MNSFRFQFNTLFQFILSLLTGAFFHADSLVSQESQWRGPNRDGHFTASGLLKSWPENGPKLLWESEDVEEGYSTPSVNEDAIYLTGTKNKTEFICALDKQGKTLWASEIGPCFQGNYPVSRCTPTVTNGKAFVITGAGLVACFDANSGKKIWSVDAFQKFKGSYGIWGYSESPLVENGKVIFTPGGSQTTMVALDASSGETVWESPCLGDKAAYASAIAFERGGIRTIANVAASHIFGVEADTGKVLWQYDYGSLDPPRGSWGPQHVNTVTPIYHDGNIYTTSGYDHIGAMFEIDENGKGINLKWKDKTLDTHHGGVVLVDGYLYGANWIGNGNGKWCCINWETGNVAYETKWINKGSIVFADGLLYCYDEKRGNVGIVAPSPDGFEVISSFTIKKGDGPHWSSPVINDGVMYIRHGNFLMAYDIKE